MNAAHTDPVKQQVAAHWDRRAAHFDEDFGHSIKIPGERAAWDRILDLVAAQRQRMVEEGREARPRQRYVVWGDVPR